MSTEKAPTPERSTTPAETEASEAEAARKRQAQRMSYWARRMRKYDPPPDAPDPPPDDEPR